MLGTSPKNPWQTRISPETNSFFFFFLKNTLETGAYVFPSTVKILITREDNLLNFRVIGGKQFLKRSFQKWNNIIYGTITFGDTIIGSFRKLFTR